MTGRILVAPTKPAWIEESSAIIQKAAQDSIARRGCFSLVLSGGNTPRPVYQALANLGVKGKRLDWENTFIFWGDERCVPPDHPVSNYRMAREALLDQIPIPENNIFRIKGESPPDKAASDYQKDIDDFFKDRQKHFDLVLLGIGEDGHTASLFPQSSALEENHSWVSPNYIASNNVWRVTLTYPAILSARKILFLISGNKKAEIVQQIIQDPINSSRYPAAKVASTHQDVTWVLEQTAGVKLN